MIDTAGYTGEDQNIANIYKKFHDPALDSRMQELGVMISSAPVLEKKTDAVEKYNELRDLVWQKKDVDLRNYYSLEDRLSITVSSFFGSEKKESALKKANQRASEKAREEYKSSLLASLDAIGEEYITMITNCDQKIDEVKNERDKAYKAISALEENVAKKTELTQALILQRDKYVESLAEISDSDDFGKINDLEKKINDANINISDTKIEIGSCAMKTESYSKRGNEARQVVALLRYIKRSYSEIVKQVEMITEYLNSNEFNISNCLLTAEQITRHRQVISEAETVAEKQENVQEEALNLAAENFGISIDYEKGEDFAEALSEAESEFNKRTEKSIREMRERRKKRIQNIISS